MVCRVPTRENAEKWCFRDRRVPRPNHCGHATPYKGVRVRGGGDGGGHPPIDKISATIARTEVANQPTQPIGCERRGTISISLSI